MQGHRNQAVCGSSTVGPLQVPEVPKHEVLTWTLKCGDMLNRPVAVREEAPEQRSPDSWTRKTRAGGRTVHGKSRKVKLLLLGPQPGIIFCADTS